VHEAHRSYPDIQIVKPSWLYDSISQWHRQPEHVYWHPEQQRPHDEDAAERKINNQQQPSEKHPSGRHSPVQQTPLSSSQVSETGSLASMYALNSDLSYRTLNRTEISALNQELFEELGSEMESDDEADATAIGAKRPFRAVVASNSDSDDQSTSQPPSKKLHHRDGRQYEPRKRSPLAKSSVFSSLRSDYSASDSDSESSLTPKPKQERQQLKRSDSGRADSEEEEDDEDFVELARQIDSSFE
jgi:hypothetical protein